MIPVSVCIIAKNEEQNIEKCLTLLKKYPFEIIVVDTGSTDRTKEIALQYADKVADFEWINDFSAARNFSLTLASHDWILIIDCDEFIEQLDLDDLYTMERHPQTIGSIVRRNICVGGSIGFDDAQRFFNKRFFHYTGRIHEQVEPLAYKNFTPTEYRLAITVEHTGYGGTADDMDAKANRNIFLLEKQLQDDPSDAYTLFQLGQSYYVMKDYETAYLYFDQALSFDIDPAAPYLILLVVSYGYTLLYSDRLEQALNYATIYDSFSYSADFVFLMGSIYMKANLPIKALGEFIKATTVKEFYTQGINSYLAFNKMGIIYENLKDINMAIMCYEKAAPHLEAARERLAVLKNSL